MDGLRSLGSRSWPDGTAVEIFPGFGKVGGVRPVICWEVTLHPVVTRAAPSLDCIHAPRRLPDARRTPWVPRRRAREGSPGGDWNPRRRLPIVPGHARRPDSG